MHVAKELSPLGLFAECPSIGPADCRGRSAQPSCDRWITSSAPVRTTDWRDSCGKLPMTYSAGSRRVSCCRDRKSVTLRQRRTVFGNEAMSAAYSTIKSPQRVVARFLLEYYKIWGKYFPGLNKRAHWHVIFMARTCDEGGVSSRAIHRTLYGSYGTDIRTCIERIKDCERDGFIRVFDPANQSCVASAGCWSDPLNICSRVLTRIVATRSLRFAPRSATSEVGFDDEIICDDRLISEIYRFFGAYDQKWRETSERVVKQKGLTPAHVEDAMDHLVTYQYWAIVMLLWSASAFGGDRIGTRGACH